MRGSDSTGAGSVGAFKEHGEFKMKLAKETGPFPFLFDLKSFDGLFHGTNSVYIGHNRSKTVGEVSRKNAHPFQFEDIMGAHNGTIDYQNKNRLEAGSTFKTDSEAIFNNIQIHGIEDTVSRIDNTEAYALTWYDRRDHTMNFIRNEHRPLVYVYANDKKTVFYASTYAILMASLHTEGIKTNGNVIEFTPDTLYSWQIPIGKSEALKPPIRKKLEGRVPEKWNYHHSKKKAEAGTTTTTSGTAAVATGSSSPWKPGQTALHLEDDDINEMVYAGHFVGYVPKTNLTDTTTNVHKNAAEKVIEEGRKKLAASIGALTNLITPDKKTEHSSGGPLPRCLEAADVMRKRAFEDATKAGLVPPENTKLFEHRMNAKFVKVWRTIADGLWITLKYNPVHNVWDRFESAIPPSELPLQIMDINARHAFRHIGRKKRKKIFYKGWKKELLTMERFEKCMQEGCLNCTRNPEWGNEVVFVSENHDFLCEWCKLTPGLLDSFFGEQKQQVKKAA